MRIVASKLARKKATLHLKDELVAMLQRQWFSRQE
ncbi:MAG: hypothetical protein ACJAYE_000536 [Candidatus Azotimanducaceae bacterium]|jgi:uncharacterized protein YdcH (DUF465 family)